MQNNEEVILIPDSILNLDDLPQIKDYSQTLQSLHKSFVNNNPNIQYLTQILNADYQDIIHLSSFQKFIKQTIIKIKLINQLNHITKLYSLYLTVLQQSFFNITLNTQTISLITAFLAQQHQQFSSIISQINALLLNFLYKISKSINYISPQDQNKILLILIKISQKQCDIIKINGNFADKYITLIDYFLRNRQFRKKIENQLKYNENTNIQLDIGYLYLLLKISGWNRNKIKLTKCLQKLKKKDQYEKVSKSLINWEKKLLQEN